MKQLNPNNQSVIQPLLESSPRGAAWMRMFFMLMLMVMSSAFAMAQEAYGIKIAGVEVTSENCADLSDIEGVSGKVSFDAATNTLTLDNATIVNAKEEAILNDRCEGLVIKVLGKNNITAADSAGIRIVQSTTILGVGASSMLNVKSDYSALAMCNVPLTIQYCQVIAVGNYGISGSGQYDDELTIRKSYVVAKGAEGELNADEDYGSIAKIADLNLEDCYITMPNGAKFDNNLGGVAVDGWLTSGKVVIEPNGYGIKVAGEEVTALNCNDLSVIDGVEGKMSYNFDTNTLTMEDVTINATDARIGILIDRNSHVKIKVVGNNSITTDGVCVSLKNESSISGPGTFRLKSHNNCGIFMRREVHIDSVKLYVEGKWGIAGYDGKSSEILVITDSYVEATGSNGSVCDLSGFWLDGSVITQPAGAAYDTELYALALDGEVVTDKVVIEPAASGINDITADVPARKKGIFTVQGVKQTQSWNELPAGIYIVDGVKRVKR